MKSIRGGNSIESQADFISLDDTIEWNALDADDDADTRLF
jgi:hypothetical protein